MAAASGSMPDSPLYPVKLATEKAQAVITFSKLGKAELHAGIADKRVAEIVYLADKGRPGIMALTTDRLNSNLSEISILVSAPVVMSSESAIPAPAIAVQEATLEQVGPVAEGAIIEAVPSTEEAPQAAEAPSSAEVRELPAPVVISAPEPKEAATDKPLIVEVAEVSGEAGLNTNPRAILRTKVANQANENIAHLLALLETAPESAKPALLRAISVLENGYGKAIESLNQP